MRPGCLVKIEDIGPLAVCVGVRYGEVQLELEGERFWIAKRLCKVIRLEELDEV